MRPPDLQLDKLRTALKRRRAALSPTPRRSAQRWQHNQPSLAPELLWYAGVLRAATVIARVLHQSALAARSDAHAHAGRAGGGPYKCQPQFGRRALCQAGCGPHVTESILQAAELDHTMVLDLGRCERCLVGRGCIIATSPAPSSMQRHAAGLTGGHPRRACADVLTACKERKRKYGCLHTCVPARRWPRTTVSVLARCPHPEMVRCVPHTVGLQTVPGGPDTLSAPDRLIGAPCVWRVQGRRHDGERQCTRARRRSGQAPGARQLCR